jgi:type II secretory pathway component GspD/PulD (secretin)
MNYNLKRIQTGTHILIGLLFLCFFLRPLSIEGKLVQNFQEKNISIKANKQSIKTIFKQLSQLSGCNILYDEKTIDFLRDKRFSLDMKNKNLIIRLCTCYIRNY